MMGPIAPRRTCPQGPRRRYFLSCRRTSPQNALSASSMAEPVPSCEGRVRLSPPEFDPVKLADAVCAQQGWLNSGVRFYTGTPSRTQDARWHGYWNRAAGPAATSSRGINRTDWVPLDRTLYDGCLIRGITGGRTGKAYTPGRRQGRSDGYQLLRSTGVLPSESRASGSAPAASSASTIPEDRWYRA